LTRSNLSRNPYRYQKHAQTERRSFEVFSGFGTRHSSATSADTFPSIIAVASQGDGAYQIDDLQPGTFTVRLSKPGYTNADYPFTLPGDRLVAHRAAARVHYAAGADRAQSRGRAGGDKVRIESQHASYMKDD
jgi:hypothetical protein